MPAPRILALAAAAGLAACQPSGPRGIDNELLTQEVRKAVGDPNTCVYLVEKGGGRTVFQYGEYGTCHRGLPSCEAAGGLLDAAGLARLAAQGDARTTSCDSEPDGASRVGWASGPVTPSPDAAYGDLAYAAVMEGPTVLPGREIQARLEAAFRRAGM
ncbi:MAG: hypothetical protein ACOY4K_05980 [Pseudomonadota bacterium]